MLKPRSSGAPTPGQSDSTLHPYALTGLYSIRFSHTVFCPPSPHTPTSPGRILSVLGNLWCASEHIHEVPRPVTPGSEWGPEKDKCDPGSPSGESEERRDWTPASLLQTRRRSGLGRERWTGRGAGGNPGLVAGGQSPRVQVRDLAARWRQRRPGSSPACLRRSGFSESTGSAYPSPCL